MYTITTALDLNGTDEYLSKSSPSNTDLNGSEKITATDDQNFESTIGNWVSVGSTLLLQRTTSSPITGTASMQFVNGAAGAGAQLPSSAFSAIEAGKRYSVQFLARCDTSSQTLTITVGSKSVVTQSILTSGSSVCTFDFVATASEVGQAIQIKATGATNANWLVDDVSLTEAYGGVLCFWARWDGYASHGSAYNSALGRGQGTGVLGDYGFYVTSNNLIQVRANRVDTGGNANFHALQSSYNITTDTDLHFYQWVISRGGTSYLRRDSTTLASGTRHWGKLVSTSTLGVGTDSAGASRSMDGRLGEVGGWKYDPDTGVPATITTLLDAVYSAGMSEGLPTSFGDGETNMFLYRFREDSAFTDSSGSGNHLTGTNVTYAGDRVFIAQNDSAVTPAYCFLTGRPADYSVNRLYYNAKFSLNGPGFKVDDLLLAQKLDWDASHNDVVLMRIEAEVVSIVSGGEAVIKITDGEEYVSQWKTEIEFVCVGNKTDTDRQGHILMTASDANAPYIRIASGVASLDSGESDGFGNAATIKVQLGRLDGLTVSNFGALTGFGGYLAGSMYITGNLAMGSATAIGTGTGFWANADGDEFRVGDPSGHYIQWDGSTLSVVGNITVSGGNTARTGSFTGTFSSSSSTAFSWTSGTLKLTDGSSFSIASGSATSLTTNTTYVAYLDEGVSSTVLQVATISAFTPSYERVILCRVRTGNTRCIIVPNMATGDQVDGAIIVDGTIVSNKISVSQLDAISADFGDQTAGTITLTDSSGSHIKSGMTAYATGAGFWLGNDSGTHKFSIGNSSGNLLTWDGTSLTNIGTFKTGTNTEVSVVIDEDGSSGRVVFGDPGGVNVRITADILGGVMNFIAATSYFSGQIDSDVSTGTAPFSIASTTVCTNLNADLLDGSHASAFAAASHTHTGSEITGVWSGETGSGLYAAPSAGGSPTSELQQVTLTIGGSSYPLLYAGA